MRASALPQGDGTPQPSSACHTCRFRRPFALHCRAGDFARRGGLRQGDAAVLCKRRTAEVCNAAGPGKSAAARKDIGRARCGTPQSADADSSPCRGAFWAEAVCKASPVRGGGCAVRHRRRGTLPLCGGNILQSLARPCPVLRRGRCLHRPGNLAMPQPPGGGRNRPPYMAGGNGRRHGSGSPPTGPTTSRCKHRPLRRGISRRRRPAKRIVSLRNQKSAGG